MRDGTILKEIQGGINAVYNACHKENLVAIRFHTETRSLIDVVLYHIIPSRWIMFKLVFFMIVSPMRAQLLILNIWKKSLDNLVNVNKKIYKKEEKCSNSGKKEETAKGNSSKETSAEKDGSQSTDK